MSAALFVDTAELLRAHQLHPARLPGGVTVWRCPTCNVDYSATDARLGVAESEHQSAFVSVGDSGLAVMTEPGREK